jgi:hypothetical protein
MKTVRIGAILVCVLALAAQVCAQNGQVKFRGTVATAEVNNVMPICYGDYYVAVTVDQVLEDPNGVLDKVRFSFDFTGASGDPNITLTRLYSLQVCYKEPLGLTPGETVEINGYFWGGTCPRQYCQRVQITAKTDYIKRFTGFGDNDWMVEGDTMYSIPPGSVGIGTKHPSEKLHVVGNVLVQGASPAWLRLMSALGDDAGISLTASGAGVNTWEILREGASSDLQIRESFPYPPFGRDAVTVKARTGNVGIGTKQPTEKLHVMGTALIEGQGAGQSDEALHVVKEGAGRQLVAYFTNPKDGDAEVDIQLGGGKLLPWGWSIRGANGMLTISNIAVLPPPLNITSTGHVGVGDTSPEYRLELPNTADADGQGRANAWKTYSSQRWKTNIRTIDHAMDKVAQLRGVYFDWQGQSKHDIGLIAEEVGRVVPEVVDYEANGTDATALAYDRLVALLVEAVKEQQARIDELEQTVARNKQLEQRLDSLERLVQQRQVPPVDR